ncbi:hypothetical protein ACWCPK_42750 [Streptomyces sp. NPDC001953]
MSLLAVVARAIRPGRRPALQPFAAFDAGQADAAEFHHCPAENRVTAHAVRADGTRRCWDCDHTTAGNR